MKKFVLCIGIVFVCSRLFAEDTKWKFKGMFGANFNATSVSNNWSGAEKNSGSWGVKLDALAERDVSVSNWANTLKEEYGRTKTSGSKEQTSADLIYFNSVYTKKMSFYVNPYMSFVTDTQHNKLIDPVTLTESLGNGLWLINKTTQQLKTRAGVAFKQLFDSVKNKTLSTGQIVQYSSADNPNTAKIEEWKSSTGGELITNYDLLINKDVKFSSEANVFSAFDGGANLRWDNNLYVKLSGVVTMQLNYLAKYNYDKNTRPVWPQDIERRLTIGVGVSYNLF